MAEAVVCASGVTCRQMRHATLLPSTSSVEASGDFCTTRIRPGHSLDLPSRNRSPGSYPPRVDLSHQRSRCRKLSLQTRASQAAYPEPHIAVATGPPIQPQGHRGQPGAVWTAIVLVCATIMALAGAFTAFILYMRPVLKRMESAAQATETASKAMEQSAKEFEHTSLLFQADTPAMIAEIEAAAQEYHQLGQTLNVMTAGFRGKNPMKDWSTLSMRRVAKDVSALTNALSPAMDQWRKRISKIATSFEVAHKAELKTAEKQGLDSKAKQGSAIEAGSTKLDTAAQTPPPGAAPSPPPQPIPGPAQGAEQAANGPIQAVQDTGKQLANAAVSLRVTSGSSSSSSDVKPGSSSSSSSESKPVGSSKDSRRQSRENSVSTQKALDLLDANEAQAGADAINEAADAAEKVASQVNQLVADLAQGSSDSHAVEDAFEQSVSSQDLPGMSEEEQALLTQLATKKKAAEQVYRALQRAEHAATAAATASGALEHAMQVAESQGVLSSSDEVQISSNSDSKYTRNEGRQEKGVEKGKATGNLQGNKRQDSLPQTQSSVESGVSATQVDSSGDHSPPGQHNV